MNYSRWGWHDKPLLLEPKGTRSGLETQPRQCKLMDIITIKRRIIITRKYSDTLPHSVKHISDEPKKKVNYFVKVTFCKRITTHFHGNLKDQSQIYCQTSSKFQNTIPGMLSIFFPQGHVSVDHPINFLNQAWSFILGWATSDAKFPLICLCCVDTQKERTFIDQSECFHHFRHVCVWRPARKI